MTADTSKLVARSQSGDTRAFAALYQAHFEQLYGYLRVLLRDPHDAEDTVQQVFVKAFEALPSYEERPGKGFAAWLFRIARNEALMHLRKQGRVNLEDPGRLDRYRETRAGSHDPNPKGWPPSDRDLARLLELLPDTQRQVLTLRYMFDMSTDEIGEVIDRTPVAVRKLQHRALRRLEERLTPTRESSQRSRRAPMLVRLRRVPVVRARRFALAHNSRPAPAALATTRYGHWR